MAKYSYEFKKKVVQEYLDGNGGYEYLAKKYGIAKHTQVMDWVKSYQNFGNDGLIRSRQNNNYSFQFKLFVVELYLSSEVSYWELALSQGINNPSLITRWVNDFRIAGPDALRPKKKGRKKTLDIRGFKKPSKFGEEKPVDTSAEHVKELEDELLKLRIEKIHRDTYHASYGLGRYTLGLLWYRVLTGNDISAITFNDFDEDVKDTEIEIAKKCVLKTCKIYGGCSI